MNTICETLALTNRFGGLVALDSVDLRIEAGQIHGLIGPNGAGKSTLLNVLTGIYRPTGGSILFNGESLLGKRPHQIARMGIARTFQDVQLFTNQSVLENVITGQHVHLRSGLLSSALRSGAQRREEGAARAEALRIVEFLGLGAWAQHRAGDLSFGWQRRVSLARAMAARPKLLLLDEPTAGMNATTANEIGDMIRKLHQTGMSVLLVEHNIPLVMRLCDRITVLDQGRVIADGSATDIQSNPDVIRAYLGERGQRAAASQG